MSKMRFTRLLWILYILISWGRGALFLTGSRPLYDSLQTRQTSDEDWNGLYDGGFGLGGNRDGGRADVGTHGERDDSSDIDISPEGENSEESSHGDSTGNNNGDDNENNTEGTNRNGSGNEPGDDNENADEGTNGHIDPSDGNGDMSSDNSDSQDQYWDAISNRGDSTQSEGEDHSNGADDASDGDDFDMGSDQDDNASDHYLYEEDGPIGYSRGKQPDLRRAWSPNPNRRITPGSAPQELPEVDSWGGDEDYPKASFMRVSYCDELHSRKIHRVALEIKDVLNATVQRVEKLLEYITKNPRPPLHDQPSLLASTLRTFSSFCDDLIYFPKNDEKPEAGTMTDPEAVEELQRLYDISFAMLNYMKYSTKDNRFTEVTCGIPWITREDDLGRFRAGHWFDNRETTDHLHRDDRWFKMRPIQLPNGRIRPWDISDGFPTSYNHRSSYIRSPKLVGTLEPMLGRYEYVVVLQSWDNWWGWQDAPFVPYGYQAKEPSHEDFDMDYGYSEHHPLFVWTWSQFRRNRWQYPTGSIEMPYLIFRRLMPALLSAFTMSDRWVNFPAKTIDFRQLNTYTFRAESIPFEAHVMPWTRKYKDPPYTFHDVIADLYSDPRYWKCSSDWKTFTWFGIAMYADQYDWSSGMNRPLGTAYVTPVDGDFLGGENENAMFRQGGLGPPMQ